MNSRIYISTRPTLRSFLAAVSILGVILVGLFLSAISQIRPKSAALRAEVIERYGGDEVLALAQFVDDPSILSGRRNYAIGMLANLGDIRALPILEKHYTSNQSLLSRYELKKAVERCRENAGRSIVTRLLDIVFS